MKKAFKSSETLSLKELVRVRKETARRLEEAEAAAREVADLCARAADAARHGKVPHAGMGAR